LLLSVTVESVPSVLLSVTVAPPLVRLFPFASLSCTVIIEVLVPLAVIEDGDAAIKDVAALAAPGTNVTISLSVIGAEATVPVIIDVPAVVGAVSVAVYVPLLLSVTEERTPSVAFNPTAAPPLVKLFPLTSFN
jgi:hypothetical protein